MPRSFAPAIPLGALALAVAVAAGAGIASAPSSDHTKDVAMVVRHHDHDRTKVRKELRKEMRKDLKELKDRGFRGRGPDGAGPPGLRGHGFDRGFGFKGFDTKDLERTPAFALLPDDLQDDVRALVNADPEDRKAQLEKIREKALAGDYGAKVEEAVRLLEQRRTR
ncbi:hypothetical protein [Aeromicrobium terrae]|uniref:Uncharacterized protein n=1 Tax=Aeromicrobium terrae TaxID=2498846 RepID=A0A5C8NEY8_9ACTN|nr:hypothetical protein [Aeromicrobium terrae]TXL58012.1 hypothetical protein FHP06_11825 [Aeromicrobium terrae]